MVLSKNVKGVSTYIGKHPGGSRSITSRCGEEVTGIFASIHSNFAWDLLTDYYIGDLVSAEAAAAQSAVAAGELEGIKNALSLKYPGAEIVNVKPKGDFYLAKYNLQECLI